MQYVLNWIGGSKGMGDQLISMNHNLGRIVIYQKTLDLMREKGRIDPHHVKLGITPLHPNAFWIKPCAEGAEGALKLHAMGNTRMISARSLFNRLKELGWYKPKGKTDQFPVEWDEQNNAMKVDLLPKEPDPQQ